jgi:DNA polymerase-3 subunit epsilon
MNLDEVAVFDLETTGVDPNSDRIVTAFFGVLDSDGELTVSREWIVDPGVPIPPEAAAIHGLTDADVADCPGFADVAGYLAGVFGGADLAGFGVKRFDLPVLAAEFARAGVPLDLTAMAVVDAAQIFHTRHPRTLAAAVETYLERPHTGAHRALDDARAAAAVLAAQLAAHPDLPQDVAELHRRFSPVDIAGHFRVRDGEPVFGFGQYRGRPLSEVAALYPRYLMWLARQAFLLPDARCLIASALDAAAR